MDIPGLETDPDFLSALIKYTQDIVTVFDDAGGILFESPSLRHHLGYEQDELIGHQVLDYIHPDDAPQVAQAMSEVFETDEPRTARFRFLHKNGDWRYLEGIGRAWTHKGRRRMVVTSRDVTQQRDMLAALNSSKQMFEKTFAASRNMTSISIPDTGVLLDVNDAWLRTLGFTKGEAVGRSTIELGCWGSAQERKAITSKLQKDGFLRDEETTIYTRTGEPRTLKVDAEILSLDDEERILFSCTDITDERRTEAQLRQSQKMEGLGQLTGGVAHDFNNLLGVIMGNAELLRDLLAESPHAERYIEPILRASERGASLTQQLLAFARRQNLAPESVLVTTNAERMLPMLSASVNENISVRIAAGADLWTCRVDPGQLENAILNLVLNARDAMPSGGAILIHASNRVIAADETDAELELSAGDYVALTISDTGEGIDKETLGHVFEPFFTTKAPGEGTGLGLSMVFGFVNQTGGAVEIDSTPGAGTAVTMLLPRTLDARFMETEAPRFGPSAAPGETVLILEDNDALRSLLTSQLEALDYQVIESRDENALQEILAADTPFDLVVSDVVLTGTRLGPELVATIRQQRPDTAVLFISGYPNWSQGLASEAQVLTKPFRMESFAKAVRAALDHKFGNPPASEDP